MASDEKILVLGGDLRIAKMADGFYKDGYDVMTYGLECLEGSELLAPRADSLESAVKNRDIVILGLPCSRDTSTINAPFSDETILFKDLFAAMTKKQILAGGVLTDKIIALAKLYNITYVDYFKREELAVYNAIPTAEGAIEIAMSEMPITLHGSRCLVLGYGRIGKILCKMLSGIGADVTATSRKYEGIANIKSMGLHAIHTDKVADALPNFDCIFNTVPEHVLQKNELSKVKEDCLIIDLASKPGGVDFEAAKEMGLKVIWALSLPGKVAPITAGHMIKDTIINIIDELGV